MTRLLLLLGLAPTLALADPPTILDAKAKPSGMGWKISVTLVHGDEGWDNFADGWEVLDMAGNSLGYRELMHPHGHNQPFTRSLSSVMIPDGTRKVRIRARSSDGSWSEQDYILKLD